MFLIGHENSSLVFTLLWQMNPYLLMRAFLEMYKRNQTSVTRIFEIVNEAKVSSRVLPFFRNNAHSDVDPYRNSLCRSPFVCAGPGFIGSQATAPQFTKVAFRPAFAAGCG